MRVGTSSSTSRTQRRAPDWIDQVGMVDKSRKESGEHGGVRRFAFSDPEGRWFAVTS